MKKFLCLSLALMMLLAVLAACGNNSNDNNDGESQSTNDELNNSDESESETESKTATEDTGLEIRDFNKEEYQIVYGSGKSASWDPQPLEVSVNDAVNSGLKVSEAGYKRNSLFQKDFNVKLYYNVQKRNNNPSGNESMLVFLRASALSGAEDFDMVMTGANTVSPLALEGYWYDLSKSDYITPDAYYYESQVNNQLLIDGHQFFASGYYSTQNTAAIDVTYVNLDALRSVNSNLTKEDLYELVLSHDWTLDKMLDLGKGYATPDQNLGLPSDVSINSFNSNNKYSLVLSKNYCQNMYYDLGGDVVVYNENTYGYDVVVDTPTNQDLLTYIHESITTNSEVLLAPNDSHFAAFLKQAAPFIIVTYVNLPKVNNAGFEWTMLPAPLHNQGDDYRSYSDAYCLNLAGIPKMCDDIDKATYLYEMFMAYSYDYVYPAYYEDSFKTTYQPDNQSCKVFDIVAKSRVVCAANVYGWFGENGNINDIVSGKHGVGSHAPLIKQDVYNNMMNALDSFNEES